MSELEIRMIERIRSCEDPEAALRVAIATLEELLKKEDMQ